MIDPDAIDGPFGLAEDVPALTSAWHVHGRPQLLYAVSGAMRFETSGHMALLPPTRAAFIPAGVRHRALCSRPVRLRTVWFDATDDHPEVVVFEAPALLGQLTEHLCGLGTPTAPADRVLFQALRHLVSGWMRDTLPVRLPLPASPELQRVTERVLQRPGAPFGIADASALSGWPVRTVQRRFTTEVGVSFSTWLVRARLHHAIDLLADPAVPVMDVAMRCGYTSHAAFSRAFRTHLGVTPSEWRRGSSEF